MTPILGIWASSKATTAADTGAYFPLQVITVGSAGAANVEFTNIPNTYTHLQIRALMRCDRATFVSDNVRIRFNSDSGTNYSWHYLLGDGSATDVNGFATVSTPQIATATAAAGTGTSRFGVAVIDILDYANTNKNKTLRALAGLDNNGSGFVSLSSTNWRNTNAITSINIAPANSTNWVQYSHFALYGIKGA